MDSFLDKIYWGNTVQSYLVAIGGIFIAWAIIRLLRGVIMTSLTKWFSRTNNTYDDVLLSIVRKYVLTYAYILINYQIILELNLSPRLQKILLVAMAVVTTYFAIRLINHAIQLLVNRRMRRRNESAERIRQLTGVLTVFKGAIWIVGFIVLLGNLGYDVRAFITGLGVGGIAIALAAQTVLIDLFSYFVIFFDKPFEIGDYVSTATAAGTVEHIGIKTTRLRSLDGEQLVMSNTDLTKSTIRNYKRLQKRRVVFALQVVYSTNTDLLKQIPTIVKDIIAAQNLATFDRAHLASLGSSCINYEVVYQVETPEFVKFMDTQQSVLLSIMEAFHDRGIEFAYPTQTLLIKNSQEQTDMVSDSGGINANSGSHDGNH
jgi:small-conductance mechanosensitive channel